MNGRNALAKGGTALAAGREKIASCASAFGIKDV